MTKLPHLLDPVSRRLGSRFAAAGHELWLVGGAVRDRLLDRPHAELDFATSAPPDVTLELLGADAHGVRLQGVEFGTVGAIVSDTDVEITTFRSEWYDPESRKPGVEWGTDIATDLGRRDFTVNAIALNTVSEEVEDPFGGVPDLMAKRIRTPNSPKQAFTDDPLRMLRAARFAATLSQGDDIFSVDPKVTESITSMASRLAIVSRERVRDEFTKLLCGGRPSIGLDLCVRTGLSAHFIPELDALEMEQDPIHHHKDVLRHTYAVIEGTRPDPVLRMGALMHDIAKPDTREIGPNGVSFHHHEVVGARKAAARLRELKYSSEFIRKVRQLVFLHLRVHTYEDWTDSAVRRYVRDAGDVLTELNELVRADCTTANRNRARRMQQRMDELEARIEALREREELDAIRPDVDGFDVMAFLGVGPGPVVGKALKHMLEIRLEQGPIPRSDAYALLEKWAADNGHKPVCSVSEAVSEADSMRSAASESEE